MKNFSATQILREIKFGVFRSSKTDIVAIFEALHFEFRNFFAILHDWDLPNSKFRGFKILHTYINCFHSRLSLKDQIDLYGLSYMVKNGTLYNKTNLYPHLLDEYFVFQPESIASGSWL